MSCYEWQIGTVKIPTKQFPALYRAFVKEYNAIQQCRYNSLKSLYDYTMSIGKGKRNFDYLAHMQNNAAMYNVRFNIRFYDIDKLFSNGRKKPLHPTKKMYDFANTKTNDFMLDEGTVTISFNKLDHSVYWSVPENNHACERAHEQPEARLLFRLLQNVKYTRNSGGKIIGNDEYNRDNMQSGGGANYVVFSFGK